VRKAVLAAELAMAPLGTSALRIEEIDAICNHAASQLAIPAATRFASTEQMRNVVKESACIELGQDAGWWTTEQDVATVRIADAIADRVAAQLAVPSASQFASGEQEQVRSVVREAVGQAFE